MNAILKGLSGFKGYAALSRFASFLNGGFIPVMRRWAAVSQQRRDLLNLTESHLKDIGITREDAIREASKSFWEV